jgi:uncharacterized membrane protein
VSEHESPILDRRRGLYAPERLLTLVDGVFAISMTLLVLDVRVPDNVATRQTSLPVATGVLFRFGNVPAAVTFAAVVLAVTGAANARLWWYVSSPDRRLAEVDDDARRETMVRMVLVVVVYLLTIPAAYLLPGRAVAYVPLVWFLLVGVDPLAHRLHLLLLRRTTVHADGAR